MNGTEHPYKYNGVELNENLGLNIYETYARGYDPAIGRFLQIDPLGELINQIDKTPYNFAWNNPIAFNDPDGLCPDCPDPANATEGQIYTIDNGSEYIFNGTEWERHTVEELDEVVVVAPSGSSEEDSSNTTSEANAGTVSAVVATGIILSEVSTSVTLPSATAVGGAAATGGVVTGFLGVTVGPLLYMSYMYPNGITGPTYDQLRADPFFPITTQDPKNYPSQPSSITAPPNLTPPAYQPLTAEELLTVSAYINQMAAEHRKRRGSKKKTNDKHTKRRPGGDEKKKKPRKRGKKWKPRK
ncbi:RHS repeat-associated core domain-containing protein [Pontimicrobium sp. SW4]|uniref:RHS repeat-associated core domain-containing protein n=1 Tax=Pontimicrobium sp. SW4 TaxID=3153519 RepID=A0AAU7BXK7_9FLAO